MSLAEKYYRLFYKVKPDVKLTNDQWKVVRMMHECLREYNKPKLPQGAILVNKQELIEHLGRVKQCLKAWFRKTPKLFPKLEMWNRFSRL